ncbi:Fungalysin metallopeptidase-domain-containing protein [Crucibulum laeve]|uniref:Extracellular metalloproteinase n=1 Tax=Crucibulum laeve TaxID=68775 RepID=A0A5C3M5A2_9AGAR|nr:Fungalysin metallopeptidase-domain-containing protein [Crucibulum laeve]
MRCSLRALLVASASLNYAIPVNGLAKSLSFGGVSPRVEFTSLNGDFSYIGQKAADLDPIDVATRFAEEHLATSSSFYVRPDSYTDANTGVTHVYLRQIANGLEVVDGNININVKDGVVISHGNSFYIGDVAKPSYSSLGESNYDQEIMSPPSKASIVASSDLRADTFGHAEVASIKSALLQFMTLAAPSEFLHRLTLDRDNLFNKMIVSREDMTSQSTEERCVFTVANVPGSINLVKGYMAYAQVANEEGTAEGLELVWKFEIEMQNNWYETAVSVQSPYPIVSVVDWAFDLNVPRAQSGRPIRPSPRHPYSSSTLGPKPIGFSYNVLPFGVNDPSEGPHVLTEERLDTIASPLGWHSLPFANDPSGVPSNGDVYRNTSTTWGNNVFAQENWEGKDQWMNNFRPEHNENKSFNFVYDPKETDKSDALDEARKYVNVSITHLFYTINIVHDLFYRYGFDEASGNFQQYNFGRGGAENDGIIANTQDGSGMNNANFKTPPDGQNPICRMYLWDSAIPFRDGTFDVGVMVHEVAHGLSSRLTGGPANAACIAFGESSMMGEGWSDFIATMIRSQPNVTDYLTGVWVGNKPEGMRHYPYSLNETTNPLMYKIMDKPLYKEVHNGGEVWAEMLWIVAQDLVAKHGYGTSLFPPAPLEDGTVPDGDFYRPVEYNVDGTPKARVPKYGNSLMMQLVISGMKLQPCRPSFFDARNAIIQADQLLTGGENMCTLWKGFAKRGLGRDAKYVGKNPAGGGTRTNGFAIPPECLEKS